MFVKLLRWNKTLKYFGKGFLCFFIFIIENVFIEIEHIS